MDDVSESLKETIKTRLSNPLWGYITLSWLGFNWQNIATLFMGTEPVNFRIYAITSQDDFYLHYLIVPIIVGFLLTLIYPYLQLIITIIHSWVRRKQIEAEVESDDAKELARVKSRNKIIEEEEKGKRDKLKTEELQKKLSDLSKDIQNEEKKLKDTISRKELLSKQAINLLILIEQFNPISRDEILKFYEKVYGTIDQYEMNKIKTELLALQEEQTETN